MAIKLIKWGLDTRQLVVRVESERQALAMTDHPGIAKVFDAGATETDRPYFVMELVKGVPLTAYSAFAGGDRDSFAARWPGSVSVRGLSAARCHSLLMKAQSRAASSKISVASRVDVARPGEGPTHEAGRVQVETHSLEPAGSLQSY